MKREKRQVKNLRGLALSELNESKGFTMIEMVVYIVLLVLVVGTVTTLLLWIVRANNQVHTRNSLVVNLEQALSVMHNEIREAQSIYAPTSDLNQLSLQTRSNPPAGETSTYVDFYLCDTRVCVKRESQSPLALTSETIIVDRLEFTEVATGAASSTHVVLEASLAGVSQRMQTTVSLRSYE